MDCKKNNYQLSSKQFKLMVELHLELQIPDEVYLEFILKFKKNNLGFSLIEEYSSAEKLFDQIKIQ